MTRAAEHLDLQVQAPVVRGGDRVGKAGRDREIGLRYAVREQPGRPERAAHLLVVREMQFDGAVECGTGRGRRLQRAQRERVCREVRLGHRDPAAIHDAVAHLGAVRIEGPVLARRDHVAVRRQRDRRTHAAAEMCTHDEVHARGHAVRGGFARRNRMPLDVQAHRLEQRRGERGMRRAVTRRVVGRLPHQCREERHGIDAVRREKAAKEDVVAHAHAAR